MYSLKIYLRKTKENTMKRAKKILIALIVLAVLVSSVAVIVATAEPEYTGTLKEAQERLDAIYARDAETTNRYRKDKIQEVYLYIANYPIDPDTKGYEEFMDKLSVESLFIANLYYAELLNETEIDKKKIALEEVYTYLAAYPIQEGTLTDTDGHLDYANLVSGVNQTNYDILKAFYNSANALYTRGDYKSAATDITKLFAHASVHPVDSSIAGAADFERSYNELIVNIAEGFVTIIGNARNAMDNAAQGSTAEREAYKTVMAAQLPPLRDHMDNCPPNLEKFPELAERYNAITPSLNRFELDQIVFLFEDYKAFDSKGKAHPILAEAAALAKVSRALNSSSIPSETEGYAELVTKISEEEKRLSEVKEDKKNALDEAAKLYEYELTNNISQITFSKDSEAMGNSNADADEYSERVITSGGGVSGYEGYWRYVTGANPASDYSFATLVQPNITNGFVMSFDFMVEGRNGEPYKTARFSNEWTDATGKRLVNYGGSIFEIGYDSETESIRIYNVAKTGVGPEGVVPVSSVSEIAAEGQWFNVMLVYDYSTHICKLYVDYEYMFDCYMEGWVEGATGTAIRCYHYSPWQYTCYDNLTFYEGTAYRDLNKFDTMTSAEKFKYYVNYFTIIDDTTGEPKYEVKSRFTAYNKAKLLVDDIKAMMEETPDENIRLLLEKYDTFDYYGEIVEKVREDNMDKIEALVENLLAIEKDSANIPDIKDAIADIDSFILENNEFINKADQRYSNANQKINAVKEDLVKLQNVITFSRALVQFSRATSLASMNKRYAVANEVYKLARYDRAENVAIVSEDSALSSIETLINGDLVRGDEGYVSAFDYYNSIPEIIDAQAKRENSKRVIACVEFILAIDGYEDTETFWEENYDEIGFYMSIIRNIVSVNNYDATVDGVAEAIVQFELIEEYFYRVLQEKHQQIIVSELDRFATLDEYIAKVGICTYLREYFEKNTDIDLASEKIIESLYRLERYEAELELQRESYADKLEENTRYFIDKVAIMSAARTYAELKPIYDEIIEKYFYSMNVDSDEVKAAIEKFYEYEERLVAIENDTVLFINAAETISFAEKGGIEFVYEVLVKCVVYYENADATYSAAAAEALETYETAVENYNATASGINAEIETAFGIVAALRTKSVPVAILTVINSLIKN